MTKMKYQRFHDIMQDELNTYATEEPNPTKKGFIRRVDLELSNIASWYGLPDTDKLPFFKYVKAKETEITARLTRLRDRIDQPNTPNC